MCSNYIPPTPKDMKRVFSIEPGFEYAPETYPGQRAPMLRRGEGGELLCMPACFGLIPHWAKDTTVARSTYNARTETVATKPSFSAAWKAARFCLVPLQAFFEPRYFEGEKRSVRWQIARRDGEILAAAGIWAWWPHPVSGERIESFSMLTINADSHDFMRRFHKPEDEKRTIVLLPHEAHEEWLSIEEPEAARRYLHLFNPADYDAAAAPRAPTKRGTATAQSPLF